MALIEIMKESHKGKNVWAWNGAKKESLVQAMTQKKARLMKDAYPHQGNGVAAKGLCFILHVMPFFISGRVVAAMKRKIIPNTKKEKGAWVRMTGLGGN